MKNVAFYLAAGAAVLAFASALRAENIVLFDASTPAEKVLIGRNPADDNTPAPRDGLGRIKLPAAFRIVGNFDLSNNTDIEIEYENVDGEYSTMLSVDFFDASRPKAREQNRAMTALIGGKDKRAVIEGYPKLAHPEILAQMKLMRNDPFLRGDRTANGDMAKVAAVSFFRFSTTAPMSEFPDIRISKITALDTSAKKLPDHYSMSPAQFFPFIDKYGQFKFKHWKNKVLSDADFARQKAEEEADLRAHSAPADRDKFGGWLGKKLEATGRFRVQKYGGKWWLVDPEGHLFWSHGVVRVSPSSGVTPLDGRDNYFENLPAPDDAFAQFYRTNDELLAPYYVQEGIKRTYDFSAANLMRKYGANWRNAYADISHRRLHSWGLNTMANSSDRLIRGQNKTPFIERIEMRGPMFTGSRGAWWGICDPFDPAFAAYLRGVLQARKAEFSNPWCAGLFVDNEHKWGRNGHLARLVLGSPAKFFGKKVFVEDLKAKYGDISALNKAWRANYADWRAVLELTEVPEHASAADLEAFSLKVVEKYFSTIRDEIKKFDPALLYMGCRFSDHNPAIISIAAKYCDVLSFNRYRYRMDNVGLPEGIDKPVVIGEFHFGSTAATGKFHTSLMFTPNQKERAKAYKRYVSDALENPFIVGTHWHQFSDQATTGRFDGENFNTGFTDICDTPYAEMVEVLREVGKTMYKTRLGE